MAQFGTCAESTAKQRTPAYDGPADTRTHREHGHIVHEAPRAEPELGPPRGVCIVVDRDVDRHTFAESLTQRLVSPTDVGRVVDGRLRDVDESGCSDAGCRHVPALGETFDHVDNRVDDRLRITCLGCNAIFRNNFTQLGNHSTGDFCSPDVDTYGLHEERVYRTGLPPVALQT